MFKPNNTHLQRQSKSLKQWPAILRLLHKLNAALFRKDSLVSKITSFSNRCSKKWKWRASGWLPEVYPYILLHFSRQNGVVWRSIYNHQRCELTWILTIDDLKQILPVEFSYFWQNIADRVPHFFGEVVFFLFNFDMNSWYCSHKTNWIAIILTIFLIFFLVHLLIHIFSAFFIWWDPMTLTSS